MVAEAVTSFAKEQILAQIRILNPTATPERMARFDRGALQLYLDHLTSAAQPRGSRVRGWIRPGDTAPIVAAEPRD